jgi:hypothetical protein
MKNSAKRQSFMTLFFVTFWVVIKKYYFYIICNHQAIRIRRTANQTVFEERIIAIVSDIVLWAYINTDRVNLYNKIYKT